MSNALAIVRSLIIYGLCLPLAIFLGYLLAMPMDLPSFIIVLLVVALPLVPVLLRWHHFLLIGSWNFAAVLFFLPGNPHLWVIMVLVSLLLSILQRILSRDTQLLSVPSVARPLVFLFLVVVVTAVMAGGFGIRALGGEEYGGKRYILVLVAILGFFAISCQRVPPGREILYVSVFFLSGLSWAIGSLGGFVGPRFYYIFAVFPVESLAALAGEVPDDVVMRLGGLSTAAAAVIWYGLARHGLRGLFRLNEPWRFLPFRFRGGFQLNQPWRIGLLLAAVWFSLRGGFRGAAIFFMMVVFCHFFLEGLHRSRALPLILLVGVMSAAIGIPMVSKLPPTVQRALSFLPLDIDPIVRLEAESSSEWRLRMWRTLLPMVPQYLWVGKGYAINPSDLAMSGRGTARNPAETAIVSGDYHSGPLTLLIPLGIWGAIGFVWFLGAGLRVLHRNYRYGDPELRLANTLLFSFFFVHAVGFFLIFGSFYSDLFFFTGAVGLSISINGGVRGPKTVEAPKPAFDQFRVAGATRRIISGTG